MGYISMEPITIARLLKRERYLLVGTVYDLGMQNLRSGTLDRTDLENVAEFILLDKFNNAARGVMLRAALDAKMYNLPAEQCRFHPSFDDRWDNDENEVVSYMVLPPEEAAELRLEILQATQFLCDGTENYQRLMAAFQASHNGYAPSLEGLEDDLLNRVMQELETELKIDMQTGALVGAPDLPELYPDRPLPR